MVIRKGLEISENNINQVTETILRYFFNKISQYINLLIKQNLNVDAFKYLSKIKTGSHNKGVLLERLYEHCHNQLGHSYVKPIFPFELVNVKKQVVKVETVKQKQNPIMKVNNFLIY
jgi:hypothetical protein